MSYKINLDYLNQIERPNIYLADRDKNIIENIANFCEGLSITFNLNAYDEISFKVWQYKNNKKLPHYNDIETLRFIFIKEIGWFEIYVEEKSDNNIWWKEINGYSLEIMLSKKYLIDFECNSGEILYDDYVKTIFYDPANPRGSLLNRVLDVSSLWTVGHVDYELCNMQRTFDIDNQDVYSFLTQDIANEFDCIFIFDCYNYTVNAYKLDNYGKDTNIYMSHDNFVTATGITCDETQIFTCFRVNGGERIYINEVNPNGTNKLYDFSYYIQYMSYELQNALKSYVNSYNSKKDEYEAIMEELQGYVDKILELQTRLPSNADSNNWSEYGLNELQTKQKIYSKNDIIYKSLTYNNPSSTGYEDFINNSNLLKAVEREINIRTNEIDTQNKLYEAAKTKRDEIQDYLNMNNWFTNEQWEELDAYVFESSYDNDNYITTDIESDAQRIETERLLYKRASEELAKVSRPQYSYETTLNNMLVNPNFAPLKKNFELGNFIRIHTYGNKIVKVRLISYTINFDNLSDLPVEFSDGILVNDILNDAASIQAQANSAAASFKFNKTQYDKASLEGNYVANLRKYGLDSAKIMITSSSNQNQVMDETGFLLRQWNEQKGDYEPEQIKMINNLICFTDDTWNSVRMAIGKVKIGTNTYCYGINAECLISKLILSEQLYIENEAGTFKIDNDGFTASNGTNTIIISPNSDASLFTILKGKVRQIYMDADGNACFSGKISGGSIDIGNGAFKVDADGKVTMTKGSININNGAFFVDENGRLTALDGTFEGSINAKSGTISGDLTVEGTLNCASASSIVSPQIVDATNISCKGDISCENLSVSGSISGINNLNDVEVITARAINISTKDGHAIFNTEYLGVGSNGVRSFAQDLICQKLTVCETIDGISNKAKYIIGNSNTFEIYLSEKDNFRPRYANSSSDNTAVTEYDCWLGSNTAYWSGLYATNGTIQTSDKRKKNTIKDLDDKYIKFFDLLKPKTYKMNCGTSGRLHVGMIAQEIEISMRECNISDLEFGGFIKSPVYSKMTKDDVYDTNSEIINYNYALRYEEFIPIIIKKVQLLEQKLKNSEEKLKIAEKKLENLEERLEILESKYI